MRKGYEGNAVQATEKEMTESRVLTEEKSSSVYSENETLLMGVHSEDAEVSGKALESLIDLNRGLIRSIALRFRDRGVDLEDLLQIGTIGMIKAARSFDAERGVRFSTYAVPLIFGEIRRHMRDEGPIKVGRYYKKLGSALLNERNRILAEEGREPHIKELALACGVSSEDAAVALDASAPMVSIYDNAFSEDDGVEILDTIADQDSLSENERFFDRMALAEAMAKMPELWKKIVIFRFYREFTQQQTASRLGLTQVKISREEKKIVDFLRNELTPK